RTAIGIVKTRADGSVQINSKMMVPKPPECRTIRSIKVTRLGTKKTKVKTMSPSSEWEATSRQTYLSRRRMVARQHSSTRATTFMAGQHLLEFAHGAEIATPGLCGFSSRCHS